MLTLLLYLYEFHRFLLLSFWHHLDRAQFAQFENIIPH